MSFNRDSSGGPNLVLLTETSVEVQIVQYGRRHQWRPGPCPNRDTSGGPNLVLLTETSVEVQIMHYQQTHQLRSRPCPLTKTSVEIQTGFFNRDTSGGLMFGTNVHQHLALSDHCSGYLSSHCGVKSQPPLPTVPIYLKDPGHVFINGMPCPAEVLRRSRKDIVW